MPADAVRRPLLTPAEAQERLDVVRGVLRVRAAEERARLESVMREGGDAVELWNRDARADHHRQQVSRLESAGEGLMFGHLAMSDDESWYVGRMGVSDPDTLDTLLIDWRAPLARTFYTATPLHPDGVDIRSTVDTRGWRVERVLPEVINPEAGDGDAVAALAGPSALMSAVSRHRTGRMTDIVATIQEEQDRIIRSELRGTLLVQGGPGTGKTAVALHRAAYLLYEHRDRLARSGVLVVGPNATFLEYIEHVLPSLGEDSAVLTTLGSLLPGIEASRTDAKDAAEVKGRLSMAAVLEAAVRRIEIGTTTGIDVALESGETIPVTVARLNNLRASMRRNRSAHNPARLPFERQFRQLLARQALTEHILRRVNTSFDQTDVNDLADEFANDDGVQRAMDALWPVVTPQQLVARLLSDPRELAACASKLTPEERALLARDRADTAWSTADIPLLDEATGLLGEDPRPALRARARERAERASELEYAQGVLDIFADDDDEAVGAGVSAERLADRQLSTDGMTVAERAYGDADWAYGHIIVDEAQELSPLALRALVRRCPTQSMTLVGDINQASVGLRADWDALLAPQLRSYRREDLTVNYRTPEEIMTLANRVLERIDPSQTPAASIRSTGIDPAVRRVAAEALPAETRTLVDAFLGADDEGTLAVIADAADLAALRAAVAGTDAARVWLGTAVDAKGLEFDAVVLVEPGRDPAPSPAAVRDLYVALTRATQTLTILHAAPLPAALADAL